MIRLPPRATRSDTLFPYTTRSRSLPNGVCNAVLLPHVESYNASVCPERLRDVATAMGVETRGLDAAQGAEAALVAIRTLSQAIGIPGGLAELGAKADDIPTLRSEERRVGKQCVSTCRSRWSTYH